MSDKSGVLSDRQKALEEEFFRKENQRLIGELRMKRLTEGAKSEMRDVTGIHDDVVLEKLVELGIGSETLAAMTLVPLVEVAWADGKMAEQERAAILRAASEQGVAEETPSYALLSDWLDRRPPPRLLAAWREYVGALCDEMLPEQRRALKTDVLSRARAVAEAAGGFLGIGNKVSREEDQVYRVLESAFRI
ncbi:MAG: hypothetical protein HKP30_16400 [Myxococcales bacterium]|nr:hypothetical protein [Myxococcales bacterium]